MGVLDIQDLGLARERGKDVVTIGALVERPLAELIAQRTVWVRKLSRSRSDAVLVDRSAEMIAPLNDPLPR